MELTKEYLVLFNGVTDAIEKLDAIKQELISLQQQAEEIFISRGEQVHNEELEV